MTTIYTPTGSGLTLTSLIDRVNRRLGNYPAHGETTLETDGTQTLFSLMHGNIDSSTMGVSGYSGTYTLEEVGGYVTFAAAPPEGDLTATYTYVQWGDDQVIEAINGAIYDVWAELHIIATDSTTIAVETGTYEYALPDDCAHLVRVDTRIAEQQGYLVTHGWRVLENEGVRTLYLYSPPATGTVRLHYVKDVTELAGGDDLLGDTLPAKAVEAVVWFACAALVAQQLAPRARSNRFFNADGPNVPKIYELQRIAGDFRALGELAVKKARRTPKVGTM